MKGTIYGIDGSVLFHGEIIVHEATIGVIPRLEVVTCDEVWGIKPVDDDEQSLCEGGCPDVGTISPKKKTGYPAQGEKPDTPVQGGVF
ncbi:MAG TPA: hypothetical protein VNO50_10860 [Pyrinomonadaceae bacterium]|nr:hypothetical protein [Pyrinomonadaceae bacterium]